MQLALKDLLNFCEVKNVSDLDISKSVVSGFSIDTRTILPNNIYIALAGKNYDGHNFVSQAASLGATAAIVEKSVVAPKNFPLIYVENTLTTLGDIAQNYRLKNKNIPTVAITGSNGKTTTKELLFHILSHYGSVCSTKKNFNNLVGLPLSILSATGKEWANIFELGSSYVGEIPLLSSIVQADIGIITSIGNAHLSGFKTLDNILQEKSSLLASLPHNGLAVFPENKNYSSFLYSKANCQTLTYAIDSQADLVATDISISSTGSNFWVDGIHFQLNLYGTHNIENTLAALAVSKFLGLDLRKSAEILREFTAVSGRLQVISTKFFTLIDDSYNANPVSMQIALNYLNSFTQKHKIAVLGDMFELGEDELFLHQQLIKDLSNYNFSKVCLIGRNMGLAMQKLGKNCCFHNIEHFDSLSALSVDLANNLLNDSVILIKGSRGMQMEQIITYLTQKESLN